VAPQAEEAAPGQKGIPDAGPTQSNPAKPAPTGRQKLTPSITELANGKANLSGEPPAVKPGDAHTGSDGPVSLEDLKAAWDEFAEKRKSQVGEYHLLKQEFHFSDNLVTIHLTNSVEEPFLQTIRTPLIEFLRERLGNRSLNVKGEVREIQTQKIAYTNKEKFDKLAEKNPALLELKHRLDLDTDF